MEANKSVVETPVWCIVEGCFIKRDMIVVTRCVNVGREEFVFRIMTKEERNKGNETNLTLHEKEKKNHRYIAGIIIRSSLLTSLK